jgi:hypothetical protein
MTLGTISAAIRARAALTGVLLGTLTTVAGCDKAIPVERIWRGRDPAAAPAREAAVLDSATVPRMLFEVFGGRSDPRIVPVAVLDGKVVRDIDLSPIDWARFDRRFYRPGTAYALYQDGHAVGAAKVLHGMWDDPTRPLYRLPNCHHAMPLAAVAIDSGVPEGITAEFLASNVALSSAAASATESLTTPIAVQVARRLALQVGKAAKIPRARLDSLDFHATAIHTGTTAEPTLIASFVDPAAVSPAHGATTTYVFVIADKTGFGYTPTYRLTVNGPSVGATYRRYIDHLDLDGDGVDELVLETWTYGGDAYITILQWARGSWHEVFRGARSWCLDERSL